MQKEDLGKRVFKNTVMLYVRMIFVVCINLYISRLILDILGVEDFGIYNIVGGVVLMLGFLNSSMSGCTVRFLTYEFGRNDDVMLSKTFGAALHVHILIAIIVLVIGETLGLWFVNTYLVIPLEKMTAVNYVYQFSLLTAVVSFLQVPYHADVVANERMHVYAYIEIIKVLLRLAIVYSLSFICADKLISYSLLMFVSAVLIFLLYYCYCRKHFKESIFTTNIDYKIIVPMIKFSGWDLYGNGCVVVQQQGTNVLINRFFGVALNAASGVATQASSAVSLFVSSFTMALTPTITKKYASGDISGMQKFLTFSINLSIILIAFVAFPLYLRIETLMEFWLNEVPNYATNFCRWMILANCFGPINNLFISCIHATGNIKKLSVLGGSLFLLTQPVIYILFRNFENPVIAYIVLFVMMLCVLLSNILIARSVISSFSISSIINGLKRVIVCVFVTSILLFVVNGLISNTIWGSILLFIINAIVLILSLYFIWLGPVYGWKFSNVLNGVRTLIS